MHQRAKYYEDQQPHSLQLGLIPYSPHSYARAKESFLGTPEWSLLSWTDVLPAPHNHLTQAHFQNQPTRSDTHANPQHFRGSPSPQTSRYRKFFDHFLVLKTTIFPIHQKEVSLYYYTTVAPYLLGADLRTRRLSTRTCCR